MPDSDSGDVPLASLKTKAPVTNGTATKKAAAGKSGMQ